MSELLHFPFKNQLTERDVNAAFDCVPESIAAGLEFLTGKSFTAFALKSAVYSVDYQGGTAAVSYIAFCAAQGVRLYPLNGTGNNSSLTQLAHQHLLLQHPVMFTEVDPYCSQYQRDVLGWTHVAVWYKDSSTSLTAMDPFGALSITHEDSLWQAVLRENQVWIMEKMTMIPDGWHDNGETLTAPNGVTVVKGFRNYILTRNWDATNWPLAPEGPRAQLEEGNPALGAGTQQVFRWLMLEWTPEKGVFLAWIGQELLKVRDEIAQVSVQLATIASGTHKGTL